MALCGTLLVARAAAVAYCRPYRTRLQNGEELLLAALSGVVLLCGTIFYAARDQLQFGASAALVALVYLSLAAMAGIVAAAMLRTWRETLAQIQRQRTDAHTETQIKDGPAGPVTSMISFFSHSQLLLPSAVLFFPFALVTSIIVFFSNSVVSFSFFVSRLKAAFKRTCQFNFGRSKN